MTASATILHAAAASETVVDSEGRRISVQKLTALDKLRLFKAAGPVLAHNEPWLGMAILACSVTAINDIPVPMPASEQQIEGLVARLGDTGLSAISKSAFFADPDLSALVEAAGN
jgi:hypothetical protein